VLFEILGLKKCHAREVSCTAL